MSGKIYVAINEAIIDLGHGNSIHLHAGVTRVREGHPMLEGRMDLFRELDVHYDLEDARSAPQDQPEPSHAPPPAASTKQRESHQPVASHEGPASIGKPSQGPASEDGPTQGLSSDDGPGSSQSTDDKENEAAVKAAETPTPRPRRGPRGKQG